MTQPSLLLMMLAFAATLATTAFAQDAQEIDRNDPETWQWVVPEQIEGVIHDTLVSPSMRREVGFNVYLPPSYANDDTTRYPVVYYLHGASGTERAGAMEFMYTVRDAIRDGRIGDVIYVFPNGGHYSGYRDWDNANVKAETWIIRELIPHIDATYRTIARREGRALCGWSMGGGGSIKFLVKYPDMFCAAATMSAAVGGKESRNGETSVYDYATQHADQLRGKTGIFMVVGEEDNLFERHGPFLDHLDLLGIACAFKTLPEVGHNLGTVKERFGDEIAQMLAKHYAKAE